MLDIFKKYELVFRLIGWLFTAMIVPMSIWFISLHVQVSQTKAEVMQLQDKEKTTSEKLDIIIEKLGIVQGELKRIGLSDKSR